MHLASTPFPLASQQSRHQLPFVHHCLPPPARQLHSRLQCRA